MNTQDALDMTYGKKARYAVICCDTMNATLNGGDGRYVYAFVSNKAQAVRLRNSINKGMFTVGTIVAASAVR
jgi:hypothetical protein